MDKLSRDAASYRDNAGFILANQQKIYRVITDAGMERYQSARQTPVIEHLIKKNWLVNELVLSASDAAQINREAKLILEHSKLPFISYPYEWTFSALKQAALQHLQIQLYALEHNVSLIDASAYNIQFIGAKPIFIDHLSFAPYQAGEYWIAHKQFCDEFLNPLLLKAYCDVDFQAMYRGNLNGISAHTLASLLPLKKKLNINTLFNVILPVHYDKKAKRQSVNRMQKKPLSKKAYVNMLTMLYEWIGKLSINKNKKTDWQHYADINHYQTQAKQKKLDFVKNFIATTKPNIVWDIGCNSGDFSIAALATGAHYVIGMDTDVGALEKAYQRAYQQNLNFLPLYIDVTNPSPAQGWANIERQSLTERGKPDAILALAIVHHLALANNVPLTQVVDYLLTLAPKGVIEFIPKQDPMVETMLSIKGDIFPDYTYDNFIQLLQNKTKIIQQQEITTHGRKLIWYETQQ